MEDIEKDKRKGEEIHEEIQKIRMTLRSRETRSLESACSESIGHAKNQRHETHGPIHIPT